MDFTFVAIVSAILLIENSSFTVFGSIEELELKINRDETITSNATILGSVFLFKLIPSQSKKTNFALVPVLSLVFPHRKTLATDSG